MVVVLKKPITRAKIDKVLLEVSSQSKSKKGLSAQKYSGILKGVFGDGLAYQKTLRNEW